MQTEQAEQREVYIEVLGGVAHIVSAPDDVDVYIIDLDEEKASGRQRVRTITRVHTRSCSNDESYQF